MTTLHSLHSVALLSTSADAVQYRLPTTVLPTHYTICLAPNIEWGRFNGESKISIAISANATRTITLHAKNLKINESFTTLIDEKNNNVKPIKQTIDNVTDFLTLDFSTNPLAAGEYTLNLQYNGQISDEPVGFYRSSYINEMGRETWLAATRFTPTHARRAFPCFDEPAMKAKFKISIDHSYKQNVISNMPAHNTTENDKHYPSLRTTFKVTPVMSTYAIAFVISELKSTMNDHETVSVWSRQSQTHRSDYALSIGETLLELFEKFTGFDHAIPKMDNVAIPQFRTDPMDNWGLATYGENELLRDDNGSTARNEQDIAMVIAREFAHEWFGDLVSPMWWDSIWLNEGFANYLQYYILNEAEPSWRMMDQFVVKNLQEKAFGADDNNMLQRPLNSMVDSPAEISKNFDDITSSKAACIIRMFSHTLGAEVFRTGLKAYLKEHAYGVATPNDLLNALVSADGDPSNLKRFFKQWINQKGYPLVTVCRDKDTDWQLRQSPYLAKGRSDRASTEDWSIPITYTKQNSLNFNNTTPTIWLEASKSSWQGLTDEFIIVNVQQTGYYRVKYENDDWNRIARFLNTDNYKKIHVLNRAQLLDDSFQLAQDEYISGYTIFLHISRYLQQEVDSIPWYPAFRAFSYLNRALWNTEHHDLFKLYMLRLMERLGTGIVYAEKADDDHVRKLINIKVIEWACEMGSVNCTTAANKMLTQYLDGSSKIPTDIRRVVLCTAIRTGDATIWNQTFRLYEQSNDENERRDILSALGCSADIKILKSYLTKAMNPVSKISFEFVIKEIVDGSTRGIDVATDFMKNQFTTIIESVGDKETVLRCANHIGSRIFTKYQGEKFERFVNSLLADNKDLADAVTANGLARAISNVEWTERYGGPIATFLQDQKLVDNQ